MVRTKLDGLFGSCDLRDYLVCSTDCALAVRSEGGIEIETALNCLGLPVGECIMTLDGINRKAIHEKPDTNVPTTGPE